MKSYVLFCSILVEIFFAEEDKWKYNEVTMAFAVKVDLLKEMTNYCHITGKFRAASHRICNLKYQKPKSIPI